ncbi:iron chelate uptake ABC transporter family permease subunit [Leucobacter rhizosphaerae]|uniref:Iron chelate uptake ABC transporter family permease subunit n=1 Tax=Leucobacter rhizosphaerae TaxID=2932245 RepID=A0ABY4FYS0_9MICO|nr:iron chelate uptake ABC transporter family permease subunit [Leucobacter rhizosphaerae]UOQ61459.1 iron chelate uptake ABC transporter family permease subunit [Leucobacter rhizosphaerae]
MNARRTLRIDTPWVSGRIPVRSVVVSLVLAGVIIAAGAATMTIGAYDVSVVEVLRALVDPSTDIDTRQVVFEWRLPRVLFAMLCGAALALSGGIFQSLTRNPLGSPDIIGFGIGAQFGVTLTMIVLELNTYLFKAAGALVGGLITALVVYFLAMKHTMSSFRLIIVGIGVSAGLGSLTSWILISVSVEKAMMAATWGAGSLASLGFDQLLPAAAVFALVVLFAVPLHRTLPVLEMGDDAATALGVSPARTSLSAMVIGVALVALVTAAAGPMSFIALAAPQISQRLTRSNTPMGLVPVMLTGAALVVASDGVAQLLLVPVGVVTVSIGGLYLAWLLAAQYGRRS